MRYVRILTSVMTFGAIALPLRAQQPVAPVGDRVAGIIAIVGDSVITNAFVIDAVAQRMAMLKQAGRPLPDTDAERKALQDAVIAEHIDDLVILQTVARDTTYRVNEDNLTTAVETAYNKKQQETGGPVQFAQALRESGMTSQEYRTLLAGQIRTEELFKMFRSRMAEKRQAPKATEKDIENFFPQWQAERGPRPASVSFQQVLVRVTPSDTALARAKAKADSIFQVLIKNHDAFPEMARKFSDDPSNREKAGELGYFNEPDMAKAFSRAAFTSPVGTITPPVRTEFGYHVIEVERHRGVQVQARHILIAPTITAEDIARAHARADSAAAKLRAGVSMQDVIKEYGSPDDDVTVSGADPAQVQSRTGLDLSTAVKGDLVGPASSPPGPGQLFATVRVTDVSPAGVWSVNDVGVRDNIRYRIEQQKLLDEVVGELKRNTYIEIRAH